MASGSKCAKITSFFQSHAEQVQQSKSTTHEHGALSIAARSAGDERIDDPPEVSDSEGEDVPPDAEPSDHPRPEPSRSTAGRGDPPPPSGGKNSIIHTLYLRIDTVPKLKAFDAMS